MLLEGLWFDKGTESGGAAGVCPRQAHDVAPPVPGTVGQDIPAGLSVEPLAPGGRFE